MKKVTNVSEEKADCLDANKRITKNVSENVHKVDSIISSARSSSSLFNIQAIAARIRLRDACERAILIGSTSFSQRMEEILWRKVYYEPLATAKKLKKGSSWSSIEGGLIWAHLNDGIAFYHHLLLSLAFSSNTSMQYTADLLPLPYHDDELKIKVNIPEQSLYDSLFRSLTCLGDLARYMLDIPSQISTSYSYLLSVRYYHQALHYNCEGGLTHSNLATVYSAHNHPLLGAVHYLRAITCEKPFEAAENNLKRMLEKSRIWLENRKLEKEVSTKDENLEKASTHFLHTCLALVSCFINNKRVEEIAVLCQEVLLQLGKLLDDYDNVEPPDISEASTDTPSAVGAQSGGGVSLKGLNGCIDFPLAGPKSDATSADVDNKDGGEGSSLFLLTPESMVTLCALFIICVKRLKLQGSPHSNMSEVLLISILLTLVSHINTRLEQRFSLIDPTFVMKLLPQTQEQNVKTEEETKEIEKEESALCNGDKKKGLKGRRNKLSKLRRRRNNKLNSNDGNDFDDDSNDSCDESLGGESSSDLEVDEDDFDPSILCSSEEDDSDEDIKEECEEEWEGITDEEHLQLVEQEGMLAAVNVTLQWLSSNEQTLKMCAKTAHNLWTSLAKLLNLMKVDFEKLDVQGSSIHKKKLVERLKLMNDLGRNVSKDDDLELTLPCLPENLMLHFVIPSFRRNKAKHNFKPSEMNLLRLYRLNSTVFEICSGEDVPLKIKDKHFVCSQEKIEANADTTKNEYDKLPGGRSTPTKAGDTPMSTSSTPQTPANAITTQKQDENSILTTSSSTSTPKRGGGGPPAISSRVASSMQSLTAQWLQHEVRNLEEKTSRRTKLGGLYLVPEASVLIHHLQAVKQILATPSHMVIIPQIVIDSLDQQKRESVGARDAIRWLEVKLRHGSRFMRAQRPHEKAHLPLIKYPKRKDKDAWEWFHLAECCYYLGAQMNKSNPKTSTVTLLTTEMANQQIKRSFSLQTLSQAAGATLQSIEEFTRKWQSSTKGHS